MIILSDFYRGMIAPWENFTPNSQKYRDLSEDIQRLEKSLLDSLSEKEQTAFLEIKQCWVDMENEELESMFLYAFKMGARFSIDIYSD